VFAMDWRRDRIVFSLDGTPVWTFSDVDHIPTVPLPVILDLGVGGSFCGAPDSTTPATARMLVDWVRVLP
jgi:beta-glucanase (GH16 family)